MASLKELKDYDKRYPNCSALGILEHTAFGPRVKYEKLKKALSKKDLERFSNWFGCSTQDSGGMYAWDVEDFLRGRPNLD